MTWKHYRGSDAYFYINKKHDLFGYVERVATGFRAVIYQKYSEVFSKLKLAKKAIENRLRRKARCKPGCGKPCQNHGSESCWHTKRFPFRWRKKKCRDTWEKKFPKGLPPRLQAKIVFPSNNERVTDGCFAK